MICPKCGEVNSSSFLFCGMCGTILEAARKAPLPQPTRTVESRAPTPAPTPVPPPAPPANPPKPAASEPVQPISGPSVLGLNQPSAAALREQTFASLESYLEPEERKPAWRRVLVMLVLLAALGGAGWWTYTNYLAAGEGRKPGPPAATNPSAGASQPKPEAAAKPETAEAEKPASATGATPVNPPANASAEAETKPAETKPVAEAAPPPVKAAENKEAASPAETEKAKTPAAEESAKAIVPKPTPVAPPAQPDTGDALFRKGEAYLYGRGVTEDCDQAIKYLRAASDKAHAKARSTMGTMYATGHCVPRDLPSSYRWFALALRADPNNTVLEQDLTAVWNQMTPPERQAATKSQ